MKAYPEGHPLTIAGRRKQLGGHTSDMFLTILKVPKCEFGSVLKFFGRGRRKTNDDGEYKTENEKEVISK